MHGDLHKIGKAEPLITRRIPLFIVREREKGGERKIGRASRECIPTETPQSSNPVELTIV